MSSSTQDFSAVVPPPAVLISQFIRDWLRSDIPNFDVGGFVVGDAVQTGRLLGKSPGVVAGRPFAEAVFAELELDVQWLCKDGDEITAEEAAAKKELAVVRGPVRNILLAERLVLNIMTRASGIATAARHLRSLAGDWHGLVAGTRKTTPGFAMVEKYALLVGGAATHRMTLSQMVMLKDNHIWSVGSIAAAVTKARSAAGFSSKIEVECRDLDEAYEAAGAGCDVVMLDNYTPEELKVDAAKFKAKYPHVVVEASGGITEETIQQYLSPHVDVVSIGKLTQGYACLDLSLKIDRATNAV